MALFSTHFESAKKGNFQAKQNAKAANLNSFFYTFIFLFGKTLKSILQKNFEYNNTAIFLLQVLQIKNKALKLQENIHVMLR